MLEWTALLCSVLPATRERMLERLARLNSGSGWRGMAKWKETEFAIAAPLDTPARFLLPLMSAKPTLFRLHGVHCETMTASTLLMCNSHLEVSTIEKLNHVNRD